MINNSSRFYLNTSLLVSPTNSSVRHYPASRLHPALRFRCSPLIVHRTYLHVKGYIHTSSRSFAPTGHLEAQWLRDPHYVKDTIQLYTRAGMEALSIVSYIHFIHQGIFLKVISVAPKSYSSIPGGHPWTRSSHSRRWLSGLTTRQHDQHVLPLECYSWQYHRFISSNACSRYTEILVNLLPC